MAINFKAWLPERRTAVLALGALGVVYGDIGTSPLYALRECFHGKESLAVTHDNVLGVLSLIFWALVIVISIKYLALVMRADNEGEGGILALLALAFPERRTRSKTRLWIIMAGVGLFGSALLYGDGMITPAISVLSAVEGLRVATPLFNPYVIPITIAILIGLFSLQRHGTGKVGNIFGPVTLVWFLSLAVLGVRGILHEPRVLNALNPTYAAQFFMHNGWIGFVVLGAVFLVVTGGEALYADMGHFGKSPIRLAWFTLVLPALLLNYLGQGALLLDHPAAMENPFYRLAPSWALYPMVLLATLATVIASQALISGAFSLTMQAVQLGYSPRLRIEYTSPEAKGQIYIPYVNRFLMLCCIGLVLGFQSSSNLAAAYGVAVTQTMIITTALFYFVARRLWKWSSAKAAAVCAPFLVVELAFAGANALKIVHGGWFPLLVGAGIFTVMTTWKRGRQILGAKLRKSALPYDQFLADVKKHPPTRVPGTAVFLSGNAEGTPLALLHNLKHNKILHERVILLTIETEDVSHVSRSERVKVEEQKDGFYRVTAHYGFMEDPNVPEVLALCTEKGLKLHETETTFFLSRQAIVPTKAPGMALWREKLFSFMARNAQSPADFFRLPANRVVELGMHVEI